LNIYKTTKLISPIRQRVLAKAARPCFIPLLQEQGIVPLALQDLRRAWAGRYLHDGIPEKPGHPSRDGHKKTR
jgi:hypothetical protein